MTSIILSAREVVGLRNGTISVLRRPATVTNGFGVPKMIDGFWVARATDGANACVRVRCPFSSVGDVLTGKETWGDADIYYISHTNDCPGVIAYKADLSAIQFNADKPRAVPSFNVAQYSWDRMKWRSPATMPAWASRISIEVTGLRVERLDNATAHELRLEGITESDVKDPWFGDFDLFALANERWDSRFGKKFPASSNPLTWRAEVKVAHG